MLKNGTYPLSVSAERIIQAITVAEHAKQIGAEAIAHGSTGAGNDQVRFDMVFQSMMPEAEIITPIRDQQLSREAEIAFLKQRGVAMNFEKAAYSINKGLWGTSVGGRETLGSRQNLPEDAWPTPVSKTEPETLSLTFEKGELSAVNGASELGTNSSMSYKNESNLREAVICGSNWRIDPAARFLVLANVGSPAFSRSAFIFFKLSSPIHASPTTINF